MYVVVTGLPASGKTTLGNALVRELLLPILDKDTLLEPLFPDRPISNAERSRLSRFADQQFKTAVPQMKKAILVSWWRRPGSESQSGTPTDWLVDLAPIVEVHCLCPPDVAVDRFFARTRHPGHGDDRWTDRQAAIDRFAGNSAPLGIGPLVQVDTSGAVDIPAVGALVREAVANA